MFAQRRKVHSSVVDFARARAYLPQHSHVRLYCPVLAYGPGANHLLFSLTPVFGHDVYSPHHPIATEDSSLFLEFPWESGCNAYRYPSNGSSQFPLTSDALRGTSDMRRLFRAVPPCGVGVGFASNSKA